MKALATGALRKEKGKKELFAWTETDQDGFEYGFHIEKVDGMIGHDGDVPGYQCAMYLPAGARRERRDDDRVYGPVVEPFAEVGVRRSRSGARGPEPRFVR